MLQCIDILAVMSLLSGKINIIVYYLEIDDLLPYFDMRIVVLGYDLYAFLRYEVGTLLHLCK